MSEIIRSPFFYVGDKYKLMPQLSTLFPNEIDTFIEPFVGGGSVFLNTPANKYIVNDLDEKIIELHELFNSYKNDKETFLEDLFELIKEYDLSCSFKGITVPEELKKAHVKTYYARYNKENYLKLRKDYNKNKDAKHLYLLLVYGFNHMIRFNRKGEFNLPVGNVDFNNNVYNAINNYINFISEIDITYNKMCYKFFLNKLLKENKIKSNDFVYFDPPYILTNSEYNKMWDLEKETELYEMIDYLAENNIKFGLSNLLIRRGKKNEILSNWMKKYYVYEINSNYISYFDNSIEKSNKEVYVTNVKKSRT